MTKSYNLYGIYILRYHNVLLVALHTLYLSLAKSIKFALPVE